MTAKKKPGGAGGTGPGSEFDTIHSTRFDNLTDFSKPSRTGRHPKRQWNRGGRK
jgi:hypothetical protein